MGAAALPLAIGAGSGGLFGAIENNQKRAQYNRDKEMQAQIARWTPWTGIKPTIPKAPGSQFGDVTQGIIGGAAQGQDFSKYLKAQQLQSPSEGVGLATEPSPEATNQSNDYSIVSPEQSSQYQAGLSGNPQFMGQSSWQQTPNLFSSSPKLASGGSSRWINMAPLGGY